MSKRSLDKNVLFDALEKVYSIIAEPLKPSNKELWKEETWNKLKDKSSVDFDAYVQSLIDIASLK